MNAFHPTGVDRDVADLASGRLPEMPDYRRFSSRDGNEYLFKVDAHGQIKVKEDKKGARPKNAPQALEDEIRADILRIAVEHIDRPADLNQLLDDYGAALRRTTKTPLELAYGGLKGDPDYAHLKDEDMRILANGGVRPQDYLVFYQVDPLHPIQALDVVRLVKRGIGPDVYPLWVWFQTNEAMGSVLAHEDVDVIRFASYSQAERNAITPYLMGHFMLTEAEKLHTFSVQASEAIRFKMLLEGKGRQLIAPTSSLVDSIHFWSETATPEFMDSATSRLPRISLTDLLELSTKLRNDVAELERFAALRSLSTGTPLTVDGFLVLHKELSAQKAQAFWDKNRGLRLTEMHDILAKGLQPDTYGEFLKIPGISLADILANALKTPEAYKKELEGAQAEQTLLSRYGVSASELVDYEPVFKAQLSALGLSREAQIAAIARLKSSNLDTSVKLHDLLTDISSLNPSVDDLCKLGEAGFTRGAEVKEYLRNVGSPEPSFSEIAKMKTANIGADEFRRRRVLKPDISAGDVLNSYASGVRAVDLERRSNYETLVEGTLTTAQLTDLTRRIALSDLQTYASRLGKRSARDFLRLLDASFTAAVVDQIYTLDPSIEADALYTELNTFIGKQGTLAEFQRFRDSRIIRGALPSLAEVNRMKTAGVDLAYFRDARAGDNALTVDEIIAHKGERIPASDVQAYSELRSQIPSLDQNNHRNDLTAFRASEFTNATELAPYLTALNRSKLTGRALLDACVLLRTGNRITPANIAPFLAEDTINQDVKKVDQLARHNLTNLADYRSYTRTGLSNPPDFNDRLQLWDNQVSGADYLGYRNEGLESVNDIIKLHRSHRGIVRMTPTIYRAYVDAGVLAVDDIVEQYTRGQESADIVRENEYNDHLPDGQTVTRAQVLRMQGLTPPLTPDVMGHYVGALGGGTAENYITLHVANFQPPILHQLQAVLGGGAYTLENYLTLANLSVDPNALLNLLREKVFTFENLEKMVRRAINVTEILGFCRVNPNEITAQEIIVAWTQGVGAHEYQQRFTAAQTPSKPRPKMEDILEARSRGLTPVAARLEAIYKDVDSTLDPARIRLYAMIGVTPARLRGYRDVREISHEDILILGRANCDPRVFAGLNRLVKDIPVVDVSFLLDRARRLQPGGRNLLLDLRAVLDRNRNWRENWAEQRETIYNVLLNDNITAAVIQAYETLNPRISFELLLELHRSGFDAVAYARWHPVNNDYTLAQMQEFERVRTQAMNGGAAPAFADDAARLEFLEQRGLSNFYAEQLRSGRALNEVHQLLNVLCVAVHASPAEELNFRRMLRARITEEFTEEFTGTIRTLQESGMTAGEMMRSQELQSIPEALRREIIRDVLRRYTGWEGLRSRAQDELRVGLRGIGEKLGRFLRSPSKFLLGEKDTFGRAARGLMAKGVTGVLEGTATTAVNLLDVAGRGLLKPAAMTIIKFPGVTLGTTIDRMKQAAKAVWALDDYNKKKGFFAKAGWITGAIFNSPFAAAAGVVGAAEGILEGTGRGLWGSERPSAKSNKDEEKDHGLSGFAKNITASAVSSWGRYKDWVQPGAHLEKIGKTWIESVDARDTEEKDNFQTALELDPYDRLRQDLTLQQYEWLDTQKLREAYPLLFGARLSGSLPHQYRRELDKFLGGPSSYAQALQRVQILQNRLWRGRLSGIGSGALAEKKQFLLGLLNQLRTGPLSNEDLYNNVDAPIDTPPVAAAA